MRAEIRVIRGEMDSQQHVAWEAQKALRGLKGEALMMARIAYVSELDKLIAFAERIQALQLELGNDVGALQQERNIRSLRHSRQLHVDHLQGTPPALSKVLDGITFCFPIVMWSYNVSGW